MNDMSEEMNGLYTLNSLVHETLNSSLMAGLSYPQALEKCIATLVLDNANKRDSIRRFSTKYGTDALREPLFDRVLKY